MIEVYLGMGIAMLSAFGSGYLLSKAKKLPEEVKIPHLKLVTTIKSLPSYREIKGSVQYQEFRDEVVSMLRKRFPLTLKQIEWIADDLETMVIGQLEANKP